LALLGSLCLFLSALEYLIPKPLPFMRIGLANLPLLLALDILTPKGFFLLALIKVLGQGIIGGALFSYVFLFSLVGTFVSAGLMYLLRNLFEKKIGFAGLGCAGAIASNGIQLVLARYFIFGTALRYLIPPFLASGFITGIALGIICEYFCRRSQWYATHIERCPSSKNLTTCPRDCTASSCVSLTNATRQEPQERLLSQGKQACFSKRRGEKREERRLKRRDNWNRFFNADELFVAVLIMMLLFLFCRSLPGRVMQFLLFFLLALLSGKKNNIFSTLLIMAGIVFFNLLAPYGKVLFTFGPLHITQGSLLAGLEKAVTLEGLVMLSAACIKSDLKLPGGTGSLLGESLRILERLRERIGRRRDTRESIIARLDRILPELEMEDPEEQNNIPPKKIKRSARRILLLLLMVILTATGLVPHLLNC
jgi:heptaprenyl diphosphate synthase